MTNIRYMMLLAFFAIFYFMALSTSADVLLWTINDNACIDLSTIAAFVSPLPDDDDNWVVGRLKITTSNGEVIYPTLGSNTDGDMNTPPEYFSGEDGVWIGGGGDFWGAAWNLSILQSDVDEQAMFAIEIGLNHYSSSLDSINFELLAMTDQYSYSSLQLFMYQIGDLNPMTATPWTPTIYHSIPEPSSSLLLILGLVMLLLTRNCTSKHLAV